MNVKYPTTWRSVELRMLNIIKLYLNLCFRSCNRQSNVQHMMSL